MLAVSRSRSLPRSFAVLLGIALAAPLLSSVAMAQDAPVLGGHYPGGGGAGGGGDYATSVPLDLPSARGIPLLPLQVVRGGNRVGAAGLGFDVPFSSIHFDRTVAYRRPIGEGNGAASAREQLTLVLNGSSTLLVRNAADAASWLALRNDAQMEVRDVGGGVLELYDGNGLKYSFNSSGLNSDGSDVGPLDKGDFYLLRDISGPAGAKMHLEYHFGAPLLGWGVTGLSIDLASVSYNYDAAGACAKHQINLVYDNKDAPAPLSMGIFGNSSVLARMHDLLAIDVTARANGDPAAPCAGAMTMTSMRKYNFTYLPAADTGQPQLHQVTMIGEDGTTERGVTMPVATYSYGQFKGSDGQLAYRQVASIALPSNSVNGGAKMAGIAGTAGGQFTLKGLFDINHDGRPDLLYSEPDHAAGFKVARNVPNQDGTPTFVDGGFFAGADLSNPHHVPPVSGVQPPIFGIQANLSQPDIVSSKNGGSASRNIVTTQLIDWNGDGRPDLVTSEEEDGVWAVYLNTPDPTDPNHPIWVRRTVSIAPIAKHLFDAGLLLWPITDPSQVKRLPLGRSFTSNTVHLHICWQNQSFPEFPRWVESDGVAGYDGTHCKLPQGDSPAGSHFGTIDDPGQTTFVEWRLQDINADGYPDLVYNGSLVSSQISAPPPQQKVNYLDYAQSDAVWSPKFAGSNAVLALMNVTGVHLSSAPDGATNAFSAPISLVGDDPAGCGIEKWIPFGAPGTSTQVCGIQDVNGDGLPDRVGELGPFWAQLGTGNMNAPFASPPIFLSGPLAATQRPLIAITDNSTGRHYGSPPSICPANSTTATYPQQTLAGFIDLNGDGIPDHVSKSSTGWTVAFGTGVGFVTPAVTVDGDLQLSLESVDCAGRQTSNAVTISGLYDIDGSGQLAWLNYNPTSHAFDVFRNQRMTTASSAAGRITAVDDGFASKKITYRSAKDDASTPHYTTSSEIVVTSVTTTDDVSGLPLVSPTLYAYGGIANPHFDAAVDRWVLAGYQRRVTLRAYRRPQRTRRGHGEHQRQLSVCAFQSQYRCDNPLPALSASGPRERPDDLERRSSRHRSLGAAGHRCDHRRAAHRGQALRLRRAVVAGWRERQWILPRYGLSLRLQRLVQLSDVWF